MLTIVKTLAKLWRKCTGLREAEAKLFSLPSQESETSIFRVKYDDIQKLLQSIAGMDEVRFQMSHTCALAYTLDFRNFEQISRTNNKS